MVTALIITHSVIQIALFFWWVCSDWSYDLLITSHQNVYGEKLDKLIGKKKEPEMNLWLMEFYPSLSMDTIFKHELVITHWIFEYRVRKKKVLELGKFYFPLW